MKLAGLTSPSCGCRMRMSASAPRKSRAGPPSLGCYHNSSQPGAQRLRDIDRVSGQIGASNTEPTICISLINSTNRDEWAEVRDAAEPRMRSTCC